MPLPIWVAHRLAEQLAVVWRTGRVPGLRPDGQTQVTIEYEGGPAKPRSTLTVCTSPSCGTGSSVFTGPSTL
jgi:S-adenosylmethionine synthetase